MYSKPLFRWLLAACLLCLSVVATATARTPRDARILTPPAPQTPRINGARVFGVRPGSAFLFTIPASGARPMTFSAEGLPRGLKLDPATGRITGRVKRAGSYLVRLGAQNALGRDLRTLRIEVGDEIALTPPMGWNSWNCWGNAVDQQKMLAAARAMVEKGLADYGWTYVNIDVSWQGIRGGRERAIQPNEKFPDMKGLVDSIHALGLKAGLYSSPWIGTYTGHIGSYAEHADGTYDWIREGRHNRHYQVDDPEKKVKARTNYRHGAHSFVGADTRQWAAWGMDYLKYDWSPNDVYHTREMSEALRRLDRDIVFSLTCNAPWCDAPEWMRRANSYRNTKDGVDTWESVCELGFAQDRWQAFNRPGHWTDPDMLVLGRVGGWNGKFHPTRLTPDEQYFHMSLWVMLAAPLLLGCDLDALDDFTLSLLTNAEVIDVNQDPLGVQAIPVRRDSDGVVYAKPLEGGPMAVGLFNTADEEREMAFSLRELGFLEPQTVRDLWRQQDLGRFDDAFRARVPAHGAVLLRVSPGNTREQRTSGK